MLIVLGSFLFFLHSPRSFSFYHGECLCFLSLIIVAYSTILIELNWIDLELIILNDGIRLLPQFLSLFSTCCALEEELSYQLISRSQEFFR
jgi:hypothetical protein